MLSRIDVRLLLSTAAVLLATSLAAQTEFHEASLAFVHVNVVPMDYEHVLSDQTVIVDGDRITSISPSSTAVIPPLAVRIEGHSRYLIPGLADMHVHLQRDRGLNVNRWMFALFLSNGVTTVRNMWGTPDHLLLKAKVESGQEIGPTIFSTGPVVDGNPPMWKGSTVVEDAAAAVEAVTKQKEKGYDFIKVYSRLSSTAYGALIATAKSQNIRVVGHTPIAVGLKGVLSAGQASIEHLDGYVNEIEKTESPVYGKTDWYSQMLAYSYIDPARLEASVAATREAGAWNCPTLVTMSNWVAPIDRTTLRSRPEMRYVPPQIFRNWEELSNAQLGNFSRLDFVKLRASDSARSRIVQALNLGGARLLAGTDTPNAYVVPGYSLHEELEKLVQAGLSPYQALSAATRDAAVFLDKADTFGTVSIGKRADLVLVDGNPLSDISNVNNVAGVVVRGHWLAIDALQNLTQQAFSSTIQQ